MEEAITRAAAKSAAKENTKTASKTGTGSKTGTSSRTGRTSKTGTSSKTGTTAKKPAAKKTESGVRLTNAEKELIKNYRKCSAMEKKFINAVTEKAATGMDFDSILGILKAFLG